ncbi:hypothetical protein EJ06DRAFT_536477 [Trichodelitschia bisporula]|uniref:Transglutaminase-like domain-containing protein n=1 Tax=Trichodelitschia bisporula TaxID=703511 RepID=A0A6G1I3U4_9PEZI|nr:hypothetical protein EJ06DRAFT_536477 [Trichodelitschia bisporula]
MSSTSSRSTQYEQVPVASWASTLTKQYRRMLSTKRMNELAQRGSNKRHMAAMDSQSGPPPSYAASIRNLPMIPTPPKDRRSLHFRSVLHGCTAVPSEWENPGLLDQALNVVPMRRLHEEAEDQMQLLLAEAQSLGHGRAPDWDYQDCLLRALSKWFKEEFFQWVNNPHCTACGGGTVPVGKAAPLDAEWEKSALSVELYQCVNCAAYVRFPRYGNPFVLLEARRGRVGEWVNCFGMLCRAMNARVRWVWNSEDYLWLEVYSQQRKRWIHVDPVENRWNQPLMYTEGWGWRLGYCIAFSVDGVMDVTPQYVRDFTRFGLPRERCPEPVLLYILAEIRAHLRKNLPKQEKFNLQREDMREQVELRRCITTALVDQICRMDLWRPITMPVRSRSDGSSDASSQKAAEAQQDSETSSQRSANIDPRNRGPHDQHPR